METLKQVKDDITYHLIKTDRFKQISVNLFFTKEFDKNDIAYSHLLIHNLTYSSKKYNTKNKFAKHTEDLFGLKANATFFINGQLETICVSADFLNPKYTEEKYLNDSLDFLEEIIKNPNVKNGEFNNEFFDIIKNDSIASINALKDNPSAYAAKKYNELMYKGTPTQYNILPEKEDVLKITPKSLYEFYKTLFSGKYKVDVIIHGEVEDNIIDKVHNKFMFLKSNNEKLDYFINHKYDEKVLEKIDELKYNQSKLFIGYRLNNLTTHEKNHVVKLYNTILGSMNDSILFNVVREENSLCYSIGSYINKYNPSITIYAGINKDNYEKTIELIKKCVSDMSNKEVLERLFVPAMKTLNTYINSFYDDASTQINYYFQREFEDIEEIEEYRESLSKVTIDEIIAFNKKVCLSCIYMLRGIN